MEKSELRLVLEYCEYNIKSAQSFMRTQSKSAVRKKLKSYVSDAGNGEELMMCVDDDSQNNKSPVKLDAQGQAVVDNEEEEEPAEPVFPIISKMTSELLFCTVDFLDPRSLMKMSFTCKFVNEVCKNQLLYKKFCLVLYASPPPLPKNSPFYESVHAINNSGYGEYTHAFIQRANEDYKSFVWLPNVKSYYTPKSYYKQFNGFREVYLHAPRVNFVGTYTMKGKYLRNGQKDLSGLYSPYHVVEYYRHLRFFPNGVVMSGLSVKKLRKDLLARMFDVKQTYEMDEFTDQSVSKDGVKGKVLKGEYILQGNMLHLRVASKHVIYEYRLKVVTDEPGCFSRLHLEDYAMRYVESDIVQPFQIEFQGSKMFKFVSIPEFRDDLEESPLKYATC